MSFRQYPPATRSISSFNVPALTFEKSSKGTPFFHHETKGIGAVSVFWIIPINKQSQTKAYQALASVELLLSGGNGKTEKDILSYIEHLGASVGNDSELLYARIHFRCSKSVVNDVFSWILQHVEGAEYPEHEIERYATVKMASQERKMQTPGYWSSRLAKERLYSHMPWVGTFGDLEDYAQLTSDDLQSFHKKHIQNAAGVLFFSGDIDSQQVHSLVDTWDSYTRASLIWETPLEPNKPEAHSHDITLHTVANTSQVSLRWGKHIGPISEASTHEYSLLNMVLGGYFGSRLMQELREKQGLTYGIGSYFSPLWQGRTWYVSGEMNTENHDKAQEAISNIFNDLRNDVIPAEELERAKLYYAGMFRSGFDGPFAQATKALQSFVRNYSSTYYQETLDHIWNVKSESLLVLAQNVLDPNSFVRVSTGSV